MVRYEFVDTLRAAAPGSESSPDALAGVLEALRPPTLESDVRHLASRELAGRRVGTEGNRLGREYIERRLRAARIAPLFGESYEQVTRPGGSEFAVNVGGLFPAEDPDAEWVVIVAHHDHLGVKRGRVHPGADDNASAVAMLLALGDALGRANQQLSRHVALLFPDAEEPPHFKTDRMGSTWFWEHPPLPLERLRLAVILDLMGGRATEGQIRAGLGDALYVLGAEADPSLARLVSPLPRALTFSLAMIEAMPYAPGRRFSRSDYHHLRRISDRPFLFLTAGRTPHYHRPEDTVDSLDYGRMAETLPAVAELAVRSVEGDGTLRGGDFRADPVADSRLLLRFLETVDPGEVRPCVARRLAADAASARRLIENANGGGVIRPREYRRIQLASMRYQAVVWSPRSRLWSLW